MDQLAKIRDSILVYLSPLKSRRRTLDPSTPSGKATSLIRPFDPAASEPRGHRVKAVVHGRINKKYLSPSDTKYPRQSRQVKIARKKKAVEKGDPDAANDESSSEISPNDSTSQQSLQSEGDDYSRDEKLHDKEDEQEGEGSDEDTADDDEELNLDSGAEAELSAQEKVRFFLDSQGEIAQRKEELDMLKKEHWHDDEAALYHKLVMRGYEPLLPSTWAYDFRTTPSQVFTTDPSETFINAASGNDFRAITALASLITLGGRVRGLTECGKPPERCIKKEIEHYIKWSERDGGYHTKRFLPRLCVVAGQPKQDIPSISKEMRDQLAYLALRHRQHLALPPPGRLSADGSVQMFVRQPPVLYGVIIATSIALFVTLDSSKLDAEVRSIAHFDFSNKDMDVWNGFAIAILVITVRNKIMEEVKISDPEDSESDSDPDT